jgi:hypothetical protein
VVEFFGYKVQCKTCRRRYVLGDVKGRMQNNLSVVGIVYEVCQFYKFHCASLLDVQGASENILVAGTMESPGKLKVIHSVIIWSSESVLGHRVLQKRHSVVLCSVSLWLWEKISLKRFPLFLCSSHRFTLGKFCE